MAAPSTGGGTDTDVCAELREAVTQRCDDAHAASRVHAEASEHARARKRDLVAAQHRLEETVAAADPELRAAEKAAARDTFLQARQLAETDAALTEATAAWGKAVDRINRAGRLAARAVSNAQREVSSIEEALRTAERAEQAERIRTEAAAAACMDARVQLAACEEQGATAGSPGSATVFEPHAATGGHAVRLSETPEGEPLVIESLVAGDREALELAGAVVSEHTSFSNAEAQLQLQELVEAIVSAASAAGYLVFDDRHPLWAQITHEEARDVVAALGRLGFQYEPAEGWHAGRVPTTADLSVALGYAGIDARNVRDMPSPEDLAVLPAAIGVDARAFLAALAPDLTVDHMVRILEHRAQRLESLWDAWGQVRPVLLGERRALDASPA